MNYHLNYQNPYQEKYFLLQSNQSPQNLDTKLLLHPLRNCIVSKEQKINTFDKTQTII